MGPGVRITVITDALVRIEYAPGGGFVDLPSLFAIHGPLGDVDVSDPVVAVHTCSAAAGSAPVRFSTGRLEFEYVPDGRPPHAGNMRALIDHPAPPPGVETLGGRVVWRAGTRNAHNLGGTLSTLDGLRGPAPLSEGLLSRDGWYVVDDSNTAVLVDGWARARSSIGAEGNVDWYLFAYGADYGLALRTLGVIAGRVPMPRRYALGSWFSRYWPYTSDEFRGIALEYASHGFALDVMVLDMDWHKDGWTGWSWNRELLPDAEALVEWLHAQGLAVTLNLHPADGVGPHEDAYASFMRALGREPDGSTLPFDAGDRAYMTALFERVHGPLEAPPGRPGAGVDFWWLDWQQDRDVRSIPGLTNLRWLNHLYARHTSRPAATNGPDDPGLRPLGFSRWAAGIGERDVPLGDHRSGVHFSGDAHTGWAMLAFQVPFTATAGNVGCFFWSHDIGGHFGPRFEEATTRWVQFGALSPALRLHSARSATLDRRPWTYEERFCDAMRGAFALRSALMPTIYTLARACHEDMLPLLRPMYIDRPLEDRAYRAPGQYALGRDLIVAPIVSPGLGPACVATAYVWLPPLPPPSPRPGVWHDLTTGAAYAAGTEAIAHAPIDRVPVFLRSGVPLAMQEPTSRMGACTGESLVVRLFPGVHGQTEAIEVYEDDGVSMAHSTGARAITLVRAEWGVDAGVTTLRLSVGPTEGLFAGQSPTRRVRVEIGGVARVVDASVDGRAARAEFDPGRAGGLMVIDCGGEAGRGRGRGRGVDIRERCVVEARLGPADGRAAALAARAADLSSVLGVGVEPEGLKHALAAACSGLVGGGRGERDAARAGALLRIGAGLGLHSEDHSVRVLDTLGVADGGRVRVRIVDRLGGGGEGGSFGATDTEVSVHELTLGPDAAAGVPLPQVELPQPPVGVRATRLVRGSLSIDGVPIVFEHALSTRLAPLTAFSCSGPFAWDWRWSIAERVEAPEVGAMGGGNGVGGVGSVGGDKWAVDFRATFSGGGGGGGLGYASCVVESPVEQDAVLWIDASDKVEVFADGIKVFSLDAFDSHAAAAGSAKIRLKAGRTRLLIKASEGGGGWGFTAALEAERAGVTHGRG